jgi:hypothetical protein
MVKMPTTATSNKAPIAIMTWPSQAPRPPTAKAYR